MLLQADADLKTARSRRWAPRSVEVRRGTKAHDPRVANLRNRTREEALDCGTLVDMVFDVAKARPQVDSLLERTGTASTTREGDAS